MEVSSSSRPLNRYLRLRLVSRFVRVARLERGQEYLLWKGC
jgi:hypothetical protein